MVLDRGKDREKRENSLFPCLFLCFRGILPKSCGVDSATLRFCLGFCRVNLPRLSPSISSRDFLNWHSIRFFGFQRQIYQEYVYLCIVNYTFLEFMPLFQSQLRNSDWFHLKVGIGSTFFCLIKVLVLLCGRPRRESRAYFFRKKLTFLANSFGN